MTDMEEETDTKLSTFLQKLELEGPKRSAHLDSSPDQNPFRRRSKSLSSISTITCNCRESVQGIKKTTSFKRGNKTVLIRDPVLKIVKFKGNHRKARAAQERLLLSQCIKPEKNFDSLIYTCKNLTLESSNETNSCTREAGGSLSSCSHQARINASVNPPPCDVTIDELASYFETSVHIPKKMSSMAEMMYI
ncbi:hypothetical protein ABEB36_001107 [Hypothenemus hampei]|uniref:Oxidative stress-responsive serine-rich protein 1 n=1 Tax=Hypothenemus hampei TaxID=57062 RepID=A0ABD1FDI7_HYPHA